MAQLAKRGFAFRLQLKGLTPLFTLWASGALILLVAQLQNKAPIQQLFLDPAYITKSPWYTGLLSTTGILCWTVASTSALGGAWVAARTGRSGAAKFLFSGACATTILLLDDMLQIHSVWFPSAGIGKSSAQLIIIAPTVVWLFVFSSDLLRTRWLLVIASLGVFAISVMLDSVLSLKGSLSLFIEDGGKFLGILSWCQYFVLTTKDIANSTIGAAIGAAGDDKETAEDALQPLASFS